jgi:Protein of unknown function (DUF616)
LRRAVYTVLVGEFDSILPPVQIEPELDYIAFVDTPQELPAPWQRRSLAVRERNTRITARWHKLHPHRLLPEHDQSLYLDANIMIKGRINAVFDQALGESPLALFRHPVRDCVYGEAEVVKRLRYDDAAIVDAQMTFYRAHGLPIRAGLHFGGVLFRRHNDPQLIKLLEDWWLQLKIFSQRDQLSLTFMLRRHQMTAAELPGKITDNPWFMVGPHRRFRVDLASALSPAAADEIDWMRAALVEAYRHVPRGVGPRLADAGKSMLRFAKTPASFAKRIILRLLWRTHLARHYHVEPGAK